MCVFFSFRQRCLEALVEEGDRDQDWRLDQDEFQEIMSHEYEPSNKCELLGRPCSQFAVNYPLRFSGNSFERLKASTRILNNPSLYCTTNFVRSRPQRINLHFKRSQSFVSFVDELK